MSAIPTRSCPTCQEVMRPLRWASEWASAWYYACDLCERLWYLPKNTPEAALIAGSPSGSSELHSSIKSIT